MFIGITDWHWLWFGYMILMLALAFYDDQLSSRAIAWVIPFISIITLSILYSIDRV
jgi:hypothetical protein